MTWVQPGSKGGAAVQFNESITGALGKFFDALGGIGVELVRTGASNPLLGACLGLWFNSALANAKVIDHGTEVIVQAIIVTAFGVSTVGEIIDILKDLVPFLGSGNKSAADLVRPSLTSAVYQSLPEAAMSLLPFITAALP
jgi:hypothetical protein